MHVVTVMARAPCCNRKNSRLAWHVFGLVQVFAPANIIGFSAQTSANATQALVDAKVDKRRKVSCRLCCSCAPALSNLSLWQNVCL